MVLENALRPCLRNPRAEDDVEKVAIRFPFVGGIKKRYVGGETGAAKKPKRGESILVQKTIPGGNTADGQILIDQARGFRVRFDEDYLARSPADCFKADCAGAGKDVEKHGRFDGGAKNVEESLPEAVSSGAQ